MQDNHASHLDDHESPLKSYKRFAEEIFWEGMKVDIYKYVASCSICQQNKYLALSLARLLQPLSIPQQAWEDI